MLKVQFNRAEDGEDGTDGTDADVRARNVFKRVPEDQVDTEPPPTGGTFDFDTNTFTPPVGWSVDPPDGTDPLIWAVGLVSNTDGTP